MTRSRPRLSSIREYELERGDWQVRVATRSQMTCDAENFYVSNTIETFEGGEPFYQRQTTHTFPRDLV